MFVVHPADAFCIELQMPDSAAMSDSISSQKVHLSEGSFKWIVTLGTHGMAYSRLWVSKGNG